MEDQITNISTMDDINPCTPDTADSKEACPTAILSKNAMKRIQKKLNWEMAKGPKRKAEKLKRKLKLIAAKHNNVPLGPSRKELKACTMAQSTSKISVVIDMSFDHLMSEKDLGKTVKQILRVYSLNRRSQKPMHLHVTGFDGLAKEQMAKHSGYKNWDVHFNDKPYLDLFEKDKLVYLTSESENIITNLEDGKIYIIGGLVDHNSQKGLCHTIAVEQNISHGQLPIGEYGQMKTRKVLTIDHVYEILLRVNEGRTWEEALNDTLPLRKGFVAKAKDETEIPAPEEESDK